MSGKDLSLREVQIRVICINSCREHDFKMDRGLLPRMFSAICEGVINSGKGNSHTPFCPKTGCHVKSLCHQFSQVLFPSQSCTNCVPIASETQAEHLLRHKNKLAVGSVSSKYSSRHCMCLSPLSRCLYSCLFIFFPSLGDIIC